MENKHNAYKLSELSETNNIILNLVLNSHPSFKMMDETLITILNFKPLPISDIGKMSIFDGVNVTYDGNYSHLINVEYFQQLYTHLKLIFEYYHHNNEITLDDETLINIKMLVNIIDFYCTYDTNLLTTKSNCKHSEMDSIPYKIYSFVNVLNYNMERYKFYLDEFLSIINHTFYNKYNLYFNVKTLDSPKFDANEMYQYLNSNKHQIIEFFGEDLNKIYDNLIKEFEKLSMIENNKIYLNFTTNTLIQYIDVYRFKGDIYFEEDTETYKFSDTFINNLTELIFKLSDTKIYGDNDNDNSLSISNILFNFSLITNDGTDIMYGDLIKKLYEKMTINGYFINL